MKAEKTIYKKVPAVYCVKKIFPSTSLIMMLAFGVGFIAPPIMAENIGALDIQHISKPSRTEQKPAKAEQASKNSVPTNRGTTAAHQGKQNAQQHSDMATKTAPPVLQAPNSKNASVDKHQPDNDQQPAMKADAATPEAMGKKKCNQATKTALDGENKMSENSMGHDKQPPPGHARQIVSGIASTPKNPTSEAVPRPENGKFPEFSQADINADHYLTKDELKNFPYLLEAFDHIDAGKNGKLEQHEYENLELETLKTR